MRELQLPRTCTDQRTCARANWLVQLCELAESHILNGAGQQPRAPYTCTTSQGSSTVDYILSTDPSHVVSYDSRTLEGWSDHTLLYTSLPVAVRPPMSPAATRSAATYTYRWDVGASSVEASAGATRWRQHTDTAAFREAMRVIVEDPNLSNEARTTAMENFLLEEGQEAGVVTKRKLQPPLNPNRWGKHLAPWFNVACR